MIVNSGKSVVTRQEVPEPPLQLEIPAEVASAAFLEEGYAVTYVAGIEAIKDILENGSLKAEYTPEEHSGAILILF